MGAASPKIEKPEVEPIGMPEAPAAAPAAPAATEARTESPAAPQKAVPAENPEVHTPGKRKKIKLYQQDLDYLPREEPAPEPPPKIITSRMVINALLVVLVVMGGGAVLNYLYNRSNAPADVSQSNTAIATTNVSVQNAAPISENVVNQQKAQLPPPSALMMENDPPPTTRQISPPPDTEFFVNSKASLKGDLAKNFRGFSFYYPKDWTKNSSREHFVDVARRGATGTPIEQILVSYYESKGTFAADREIFQKLVNKSDQDLKKALGDGYKLLSQGETNINGEWKAYEMKFQQEGVTKNGDKITLWGRRLWIPAARSGVKSGFVITMLATSLSPEVKSADDLGVKGELATVMQTFEPATLDKAD
jgi:hypothetical protein